MRLLLTTLAAVLALLAASASPVQAAHGGEANSGPPDNRTHYVVRVNLTVNAGNSTAHALGQIDRSDMNATFADGPEIDVRVHDSYYGRSGSWAGYLGLTNCQEDEWWFDGDCDVYRVRYNLSYMAGRSYATWQSLACHEMGHTTGLGHRTVSSDADNNSCMRSQISYQRPRFDAHDINAINATF